MTTRSYSEEKKAFNRLNYINRLQKEGEKEKLKYKSKINRERNKDKITDLTTGLEKFQNKYNKQKDKIMELKNILLNNEQIIHELREQLNNIIDNNNNNIVESSAELFIKRVLNSTYYCKAVIGLEQRDFDELYDSWVGYWKTITDKGWQFGFLTSITNILYIGTPRKRKAKETYSGIVKTPAPPALHQLFITLYWLRVYPTMRNMEALFAPDNYKGPYRWMLTKYIRKSLLALQKVLVYKMLNNEIT